MSISNHTIMKHILSTILCVFLLGALNAQDESIFLHYHINPVLLNPAAAGFDEGHELFLNARLQFTGFEGGGTPNTYALSYNGRVSPTFGLGAQLFREDIASLTRTKFQLNYAFQFNRFENFNLGIGFSTEFESIRVPSSYLQNPLVDINDISLDEAIDGRNFFDASLGAWAVIKENTFVGLSIPNLISQRIDNIGPDGPDDTGLFRYYILTGGHAFPVEGFNFILEPSILIRSARNSPFGVDFTVKAKYLEEKIITGLTYRSGTGGNIALLLGSRFNDFRIFYSYDFAFQRFQRYNSGSHELTLSLEFGNKEKDQSKKHRR